jgi:outer membrane protein assembly factor BamB
VMALNASTGSVIRSTNETGNPSVLAYDGSNHKTYVTFADSNFTQVFDGNGTPIYKINLHFRGINDVAYSPTTGQMYFVGHDLQTGVSEIVIVHNYAVVQTINVSAYGAPASVTYDAAMGDMYVSINPNLYSLPTVLVVS